MCGLEESGCLVPSLVFLCPPLVGAASFQIVQRGGASSGVYGSHSMRESADDIVKIHDMVQIFPMRIPLFP